MPSGVKMMMVAAAEVSAEDLILTEGAEFDGSSDYMTRGATLTGAADNSKGIISFWFRHDISENGIIFRSQAGLYITTTNISNQMRLELPVTVGGDIKMETTNAQTPATPWHHYLVSWDFAFSNGNKLRDIYLDDVVNEASYTDGKASTDIDHTGTNWAIGADWGGSEKFDGGLAELYFEIGTYLDLSIETNRRKFISSTGKPINLGADGSTPTGTAPIVYCRVADGAAASTFATNLGSGGNFSIIGGLELSPSSPSD